MEAADPEITAEAQQEIAGFDLGLTNVVETIGLDLVPTDEAEALVPEEFVLAGEGGPVTPIVVRTSHADGISVNGGTPTPGSVVQIGLAVVPPDGTGDVNSYTLWYCTDHALLAYKLLQAGFLVQYVPSLDYDLAFSGGVGDLHVSVPFPGYPRLVVDGTVAAPSGPPAPFVANWWVSTWHRPRQAVDGDLEPLLRRRGRHPRDPPAEPAREPDRRLDGGVLRCSTAYNEFPTADVTVDCRRSSAASSRWMRREPARRRPAYDVM